MAVETDEALMKAYQQGELAAFEELYRRHSGRVYGYLRGRLKGDREAEDLFQQVFLKLHHHRDRYDTSLPFLPWIFSIARNVLIDYVRKPRPVAVESQVLEREPAPEAAVPALSFADAVSGLPQEQRRLLELRYREGLSFEEISRKTGVNAPTARKRVSRAIAFLKERFGGRHE
jgi:RNA polymerase sigma factor (sigma-70 family)